MLQVLQLMQKQKQAQMRLQSEELHPLRPAMSQLFGLSSQLRLSQVLAFASRHPKSQRYLLPDA
jgi:hypothetical protein